MFKLRKKYVLIIVITLFVSIISTYIHHPDTPTILNIWGFKYNDIVYGVFNNRFSHDLNIGYVFNKWYQPEKYYVLTTKSRVLVYPYIDYQFEYPPLIGLIWFVSTNLAIYISLPREYDSTTYRECYKQLISIHYIVHAIANTTSLIVLVLVLDSIIYKLGYGINKYRVLLYFLPSVVIYLVYNWDIMCALFLIISLKYFIDNKWFRTGLFLGLSISTKLLTIFISIVVLIHLLRRLSGNTKRILYYILGLLLGGGAPFIFLIIISPRGFIDFLNHHATWYCENCLYQLFIHDVFSSLHRIVAFLLIVTLLSTVLYLFSINILSDVLETSLIVLIITISLNYVFSPQMILLITPLAISILDKTKLLLYCVADSLNSLVIILFFEDLLIRRWLNDIGIPVKVEFNPWSITSIVQWIAITRILLLLLIVMVILINRLKNTKLVVVF